MIFKLNILSLLYIGSSPTISLAELLAPNQIAEIAIKKGTAWVIWSNINRRRRVATCCEPSIEQHVSRRPRAGASMAFAR